MFMYASMFNFHKHMSFPPQDFRKRENKSEMSKVGRVRHVTQDNSREMYLKKTKQKQKVFSDCLVEPLM